MSKKKIEAEPTQYTWMARHLDDKLSDENLVVLAELMDGDAYGALLDEINKILLGRHPELFSSPSPANLKVEVVPTK